MRLWISCGKPVDKAVDKRGAKVIHNLIPSLSTGFAQAENSIKPLISMAKRVIPS